MTRLYSLYFFAFVLLSCSGVNEYSPNQVFDHDSPVNVNIKNLERLEITPANDDTVTIAFIGDSQRFYDEVDYFIDAVNQKNEVDFVFIAGDISDFGLLAEFEWINSRLTKLDKPYITVIGNHDVVANGEEVYKRMFGPLDFSFVYDSIRFVVHNTNSREYMGDKVPDMPWLSEQMKGDPSVNHIIAVSHVPPFDSDFNEQLTEAYTGLFRNTPGFLLSLHGHIHNHTDGYPFEDDVRYITSHSFDQRKFLLIKIYRDQIFKDIIDY